LLTTRLKCFLKKFVETPAKVWNFWSCRFYCFALPYLNHALLFPWVSGYRSIQRSCEIFPKKESYFSFAWNVIFRPYFHQINSSLPNMKQVVLISELSIFWEQSPGLKNNLIFGEKCLKIDIKLDNMVIVSQFLLAYIIISDNIKKTSILKK